MNPPVTPKPPDVIFTLEPSCETPETVSVEFNIVAALTVNPPVTPKPPPVIFTLEAKVATPVTPRVEDAVRAPKDVREVWKVEAPVIPIPPEVTKIAPLFV